MSQEPLVPTISFLQNVSPFWLLGCFTDASQSCLEICLSPPSSVEQRRLGLLAPSRAVLALNPRPGNCLGFPQPVRGWLWVLSLLCLDSGPQSSPAAFWWYLWVPACYTCGYFLSKGQVKLALGAWVRMWLFYDTHPFTFRGQLFLLGLAADRHFPLGLRWPGRPVCCGGFNC